jgi:hypothetical protein
LLPVAFFFLGIFFFLDAAAAAPRFLEFPVKASPITTLCIVMPWITIDASFIKSSDCVHHQVSGSLGAFLYGDGCLAFMRVRIPSICLRCSSIDAAWCVVMVMVMVIPKLPRLGGEVRLQNGFAMPFHGGENCAGLDVTRPHSGQSCQY